MEPADVGGLDVVMAENALRRSKWVLPIGVAILAVVLAGCRGTIDLERATPAGERPTAAATAFPTPTPKPARLDCDAIVESTYFVSLAEKDWFFDNCLSGPPESFLYNQIPGIGTRVIEIFSVDRSVCGSGLVGITAFHRPYLEGFSYLDRSFCSNLDPVTLAFPAQPFVCASGEIIEATLVTLPFLDGRVREETEVFCVPSDEPSAAPVEPLPLGLRDGAVWTT